MAYGRTGLRKLNRRIAKALTGIPHSKPWITDEDIKAVVDVLASNMIGQGDLCRKLEIKLANWVSGADGIAVGSGSAALVLALNGIGVAKEDEVIIPSYVCTSLLEAVLAVNGMPVICDVGSDWVVTAETIKSKLSPRTKAIIVPHMYGIFADVQSIRSLGYPVIEDCAQAVEDEGKRVIQGDIAIFSLHPTKCLSAGEGGVAVSSETKIIEKMRRYRDGNHTSLQSRYFSPLSDINAGLGLSQLSRYSTFLSKRKTIAGRYRSALKDINPGCAKVPALDSSMFFRFPVIKNGGVEKYQATFEKKGVHVRRGVDKLLHRMMGFNDGDFPVSTELFLSTISFPIYPALSETEIHLCINAIREVFTH